MANLENRIKTLLEQTSFLLTKQREAQKECARLFHNLLDSITARIEKSNDTAETKQLLEEAHDLVSGQAQRLFNEAQEDINFLDEQQDILLNLQKEPDKEKKRDFLASIIEEDEELPDTATFKQEILHELAMAHQSLVSVIDDLKNGLEEGDIKEVKLLLESLLSDTAGEFEDDEDEDDEDNDEDGEDDLFDGNNGNKKNHDHKNQKHSKSSSCCQDDNEEAGGCGSDGGCGSCSTGCGGGSGVDIFSYMSNYDKELENDLRHAKEDNVEEN